MRLLFAIVTLALFSIPMYAQVEMPDTSYQRPSNMKPRAKSDAPAYPLPDPLPFGQGINAEGIKEVLFVLASDSLKGRETGEEGQRKAANFLANCMKNAGIPPAGEKNTYFQPILLERNSWKQVEIEVDGKTFKHRDDFYVFSGSVSDAPSQKFKDVLFLGYGIDDPKYSDYTKNDVKGKAIIVLDGEPLDSKGNSLVSGTPDRTSWSINHKRKLDVAKAKGAAFVFFVDPKIAENLKKNRRLISTYGWTPVQKSEKITGAAGPNFAFVSEAMANAIYGSKQEKVQDAIVDIKSGKPLKAVKIKNGVHVMLDKETNSLEGSNVIGFIEGSDPELKKEIVVITAHYDHLGHVDERIYYGADDNASGSSGVVEIARAFAEAKQKGVGPKRSVLCMLVSGEEKGLLGSSYYVEFPLFPLKKTIANINIDMIGRQDGEHTDNDYVHVIGSNRLSTELHEIQERNNRVYTKMKLEYKYNDPNDPNHYYERSDHYNFAERGIPALFYFNGTHADYHKATDTPDKIDCAAAAKRAQLAFYTAWELANRPTAIVADKK
jgi:hypothetical protein